MSYNKVFCSRNFQKKIVIIVIHECTKNRQGEILNVIPTHITSIKYEHTGRNITISYSSYLIIKQLKFALPIILKFHFITKTITPSLHDIIDLAQR